MCRRSSLQPFAPATPNTDLTGTVVQFAGVGGTPIPQGGAVLVARGTAAPRLPEEAPVGTSVTIRIILRPEWTGITERGRRRTRARAERGPGLSRQRGVHVQSARAAAIRAPAVGQLADGRILMVVVDGRRPGYSVGMTNFELAQALVRLGAVTGSALDGGGSSAMAFDGPLLNRPSDGGERAVSTALQLMYYGVYAPTPDPLISPNGDGVGERQRALSYKVVRPVERHRDARRSERHACLHRDGRPRSRARTRSPSRPRRSIRLARLRRRPRAAGASTSRPPTISARASTTTQTFTVN